MSADRLDLIRERYLGAQTIEEFTRAGGDSREYAHLVFAGEVFGPSEDPTDAALGVNTAQDLAEALEELKQR